MLNERTDKTLKKRKIRKRIWFIPAAILVSFIGGEVCREKDKVTFNLYNRSAGFTQGSDRAQTDKGEIALSAPVFRGRRDQLYVPLDDFCRIFNMKWSYARRNNYLTIETFDESVPVPRQP